METTYIVATRVNPSRIEVTYIDNNLTNIKMSEEMEETRKGTLLAKVPLTLSAFMSTWLERKDVFLISRKPTDLSFDAFWNAYAYKIGNKDRSKRLWGLMSEDDKSDCLTSIERYNSFLVSQGNLAKAFPETFLNQKRWQNSFK